MIYLNLFWKALRAGEFWAKAVSVLALLVTLASLSGYMAYRIGEAALAKAELKRVEESQKRIIKMEETNDETRKLDEAAKCRALASFSGLSDAACNKR